MKTMTRTALAAVAAAVLLSPVAWAADVTPAAGAKTAQTETTAPKATPKPKRTRAPSEITRQAYVDHAREMAEKRFDAMDTNHDGKLTVAERRAYYKKVREERAKWREEHMKKKAPSGATAPK